MCRPEQHFTAAEVAALARSLRGAAAAEAPEVGGGTTS